MTRTTRRHALALAATGLAGSLAGCASVTDSLGNSESPTEGAPAQTTTRNGTQTNTENTANETTAEETTAEETTADEPDPSDIQISEPDVFSSPTPTPSNPEEYRYATMGPRDDAPTATVYGNWKCPHTREFVREELPELVDEFVASGDVALQFRTVAYVDDEPFLGPDAPRASRAGLAAWNVDPDSFWAYFAYVFDNQPPEREAWAQPDVLARFATEAGLASVDQFESEFESDTYGDPVAEAATEFQDLDADAIPRVVTDEEVTAPNLDPEATREQFRDLADQDD